VVDLRNGLPEAVAIWYQKYQPPLLKYVTQKVSDRHDAEEIVREVFLNALRQLPLFRGEASLHTWMKKIAAHEVADFYRKRYAKKIIRALPLSQLLFAEDPKDMHETAVLVKQALKELRTDYQELLLLKYIDNLSVAEIAQRLQKSLKSVESDLFRARREFKRAYATLTSLESGV
jgi:RNA polymerase sigma-70 factor (ECF subfamily)